MTMNVEEHPGAPPASERAADSEAVAARVFSEILRRTRHRSGDRYLVLGEGAGLACGEAPGQGEELTCFEVSAALVVGKGRFDTVTCFDAFHQAGNRVRALQEAARVVKPDGIVAIVTCVGPSGLVPQRTALSDKGMLRQVARAGGLRPIQLFDVEGAWSQEDRQGRMLVGDPPRAAVRPHTGQGGGCRIRARFRVLLAEPIVLPRPGRAGP